MATRSFISRRMERGYEGVYCHWDGYLDHNGVILQTYYKDPHKVQELLSFGDISILGPEIGSAHSFDERPKGTTTTFYGRDQGANGQYTVPTRFASFRDVLDWAASMGCEYVYLFNNGGWTYCVRSPKSIGCDNGSEFSPLESLETNPNEKVV